MLLSQLNQGYALLAYPKETNRSHQRFKFWLIFLSFLRFHLANRVKDASELRGLHGDGILLQGSVNEGTDCFFMIMKLLEFQLNRKIFMCWFLFWALVFDLVFIVSGNAEGDALNALKTNLQDPNNVLQSWNHSLVNPCAWFYVTCNSENSVTRVELGNANLSGQLVPQLGQLTNLQYLKIFSNNISGRIPDELGNLTNLVSLDLSLNALTGPIPDLLGNLEKLRFLRLNNNSLSGNIPMTLTNVSSLQALDLSSNQLEGDIPINGSFTKFTPMSFAYNRGLIFPKVAPSARATLFSIPSDNNYGGAIGRGVAASAAPLFVASALLSAGSALAVAWWRRRQPLNHLSNITGKKNAKVRLGQLKRFSLSELELATDNFSSKNILGGGGFGKVYKGCLADGSLVAVKRLEEDHTRVGVQQFQAEVEIISMALHHRNLLQLHGFCMTPTERMLVYPFMVNGSVASCLRGRPKSKPPLDWGKRKPIALGAARGLAHLHDHCDWKIIHRDVKAANILLDEKFEVVVGDLGLAKHMNHKANHITIDVCGTIGHIAPEYASTRKLTEKAGVFGYGVMLLELLTGRGAVNLVQQANDNNVLLHDWVKGLVKDKKLETLVDGDLEGQYNEEEVEQLVQVALLCTQGFAKERSKMFEVVKMLEGNGLDEKEERSQQEV